MSKNIPDSREESDTAPSSVEVADALPEPGVVVVSGWVLEDDATEPGVVVVGTILMGKREMPRMSGRRALTAF